MPIARSDKILALTMLTRMAALVLFIAALSVEWLRQGNFNEYERVMIPATWALWMYSSAQYVDGLCEGLLYGRLGPIRRVEHPRLYGVFAVFVGILHIIGVAILLFMTFTS